MSMKEVVRRVGAGTFIVALSLSFALLGFGPPSLSPDPGFPAVHGNSASSGSLYEAVNGSFPVCGGPYVGYAHVSYVAWRVPYFASSRLELRNETGLVSSGLYTPPSMPAGYRWRWSWAEACGDKPFAFLSSDSWRGTGSFGIGGNAFVVDANGSGSSRHFYFYASPLDDPSLGPKATTVFGFRNGTSVSLQIPGTTPTVRWSGTLNRGQHHTEFGLSNQYLEVVATEDVSVLEQAVNGFYIPSENGLFAGTHFVTRVRWNGYFEPLEIGAHYNGTDVAVTYLDTGGPVWQGTLNRGDVQSVANGPIEFYEIQSSKPVTVAILGQGGYAVQDFAPDAAGTRFGTDFLSPVAPRPNSTVSLFSFFNGTHVDVYNATSGSLVSAFDLNASEFRSIDASLLSLRLVRIQSSEPITVHLWNGLTGADAFAPIVLPKLPDLVVESSGIVLAPPNPVAGQSVFVQAEVRNAGDVATGTFVVRAFDGPPGSGPQIGDDAFPDGSVASGGSFTATVPWIPPLPGAYSVCVEADSERYVAESDETNNQACVSVTVAAPPDYRLANPQPSGALTVGLSLNVSLSIDVANDGGAANATTTIAFSNASTPGSPFATFPLSPVAPGGTAGPFSASWASPAAPGAYTVVALADYGDALAESDETNNAHTWTVNVVPGPVTTLVVGQPNVMAGATYVTSATPLSFAVLDQSGTGIRRTMYRVDNGTWTDYTGTGPFALSGEGERYVEWYSEDNANNSEAVHARVLRVDNTPPATTLAVGDPKHVAADTFVTSFTPLALPAMDGGTTPVGLAATEYRVGGSPWAPYAAPFTLSGEGPHTVEYRSRDLLGNEEPAAAKTLVVDDSSPTVLIDVGIPRYEGANTFVTSETPFAVSAQDGGPVPAGIASVEWRVGGPWNPYAAPFTLAGPDGPTTVEYRATDFLGHAVMDGLTVVLDDTPPVTTPSRGSGTYAPDTAFEFAASDGGSGVARTEVRVNGGAWTTYAAPLEFAEGDHSIAFRSIDNLNNTEAGRTLSVTIEGAPVIPPETNWKPLVAAVFAAILFAASAWSARRTPWRHGSRRALRAFAVTGLPFVAAETATGVVSLFTGLLAIPPLIGAGTAVDLGILVAGIAVLVHRVRRWTPPK